MEALVGNFALFDRSSLTLRRGCVTPKVLANWKEASGMDPELIDGYEELPEAAQEKVKRALEQCHVDDEDWNGVSMFGTTIPVSFSNRLSGCGDEQVQSGQAGARHVRQDAEEEGQSTLA